jgi:hypothetical protein
VTGGAHRRAGSLSPLASSTHSHAGEGLTREASVARPLLAQGVTTLFVNPLTSDDLATQRALRGGARRQRGATDRARAGARPSWHADRVATADELSNARARAAAMEQGAFGLSSGLFYALAASRRPRRSST